MSTVYTVQADTEAEAAAEQARLCRLLDAAPLGRPIDPSGRGRWMARAEAKSTLPGGGSGRGSETRR